MPDEARLRVQRPNIFVLYEQNIGVLTPLIADQLRDMEKTYPPDWIDEAFEIAVSRNKRHLRYIQSVLKRWETEGRRRRIAMKSLARDTEDRPPTRTTSRRILRRHPRLSDGWRRRRLGSEQRSDGREPHSHRAQRAIRRAATHACKRC